MWRPINLATRMVKKKFDLSARGNGFNESFNGKLRDELLHRRHSSLDDQTPAEFAASCAPPDVLPENRATGGSRPASN